MERITNKWNDEIRNKAISIIRNLSTENSLSFEEKGVLSSFLVIERTENSKLAHYEDMEGQGLLTVIDNETFKRDNLDRCTHRHCNKCDKYRRDLQLYKDLEEQGRLIELPCAVGDTVYWISESDACLFCNGPCYERCEEGALKIKEIPFKQHMLNEIGEIIFLTKEEAEAKLKEMEGAE